VDADPVNVRAPYSFKVGMARSRIIITTRLFASVTHRDAIMFGFNSTEPVDFMVVLGDAPEWWFNRKLDEDTVLIVNLTNAYSYFDYLKAPEDGVISFCFKADPEVFADVTFKGSKLSFQYRFGGFDEDISDFVGAARAFLKLNDVDVGKYLQHSVENGVPNYSWQKKLGIKYPWVTMPCDYIAVRFEQANRPGHWYEVWVEQDSMQVIGGGTCR